MNQTITFNASASYDPDGEIIAYNWSFGDGNSTNTTKRIIAHSYSSAGDYIVNLTVKDNKGLTHSTNIALKVANILSGWVIEVSKTTGGYNTYNNPNVTISISNGITARKTKTFANGYYFFTDIPEGKYSIIASKLGHTFNESATCIVGRGENKAPVIKGRLDHSVINAAILAVDVPEGVYSTGDQVNVTYSIKNTGKITHTFYAGYSVQDEKRKWWNAPYKGIVIEPGEIRNVNLTWLVPMEASVGKYDIGSAELNA